MGSSDSNSRGSIGRSQTAAVTPDAHVALSVDTETHADTTDVGLQSNVLLQPDDDEKKEEQFGPTTAPADGEPEEELPVCTAGIQN